MKKIKQSDFIKFQNNSIIKPSKMTITTSQRNKIGTKVIKYKGEYDLKISGLEFLNYPFFTSRTKKREVNLEYLFVDEGVKLTSTITSRKGVQGKQPGVFEENIYSFILEKTYEDFNFEKNKFENLGLNKQEVEKELKVFMFDYNIKFEIKELLEELELKPSPSYYKRVTDALNNIKNTTYRFESINRSKFFKHQVSSFEGVDIKLLNFKWEIINNRRVYVVEPMNELIKKMLIENRVLNFTSGSIREIGKKSMIALRIYKYISKKRYGSYTGVSSVYELARIAPYEIEAVRIKNGKSYCEDLTRKVTAKLAKLMEILKNTKYLDDYSFDSNTGEFIYTFSKKKGIITHYLYKNNFEIPLNIIENKNTKNSAIKTKIPKKRFCKLERTILKAKKNIYISKKWNSRMDNKVKNLTETYNEDYAIFILNELYKGVNSEIKKTLIQYTNGIIKNKSFKDFKKLYTITKANPSFQKHNLHNNCKKEKDETVNRNKELRKKIMDEYEKMDDNKKIYIEKNIRDVYLKTTNSKSFNKVHEMIFSSMKDQYIFDYLKEKYIEVDF